MSTSHTTYLNLHIYCVPRDVRKLIYARLSPTEKEVIRCAHNSKRIPVLPHTFVYEVTKNGYIELLKWANVPTTRPHQWNAGVCCAAAEGGQLGKFFF